MFNCVSNVSVCFLFKCTKFTKQFSHTDFSKLRMTLLSSLFFTSPGFVSLANCSGNLYVFQIWKFRCLQAQYQFLQTPHNHRVREWLSLEGTSGDQLSNAPLKQEHLKQVAQNHLKIAFKYLQEWKFHYLTGQPVLVFSPAHSEKVSSGVHREPPVFQLVPLPLVLSLAISERSLVLAFLHVPFRYLYILVRPSLSLLFSRLNSHSTLSLSL